MSAYARDREQYLSWLEYCRFRASKPYLFMRRYRWRHRR